MWDQTIIVGFVGRDPELRFLPDGTAVCDFSVAVNRTWTDKDGNKQERVKWYRVNCWRKLAETVAEYVKKGRQVMVIGDPSASAWIDEEGEARATLELTAYSVKFLGKKEGGGHENPAPPEDIDNLQDIPF